MEEAYAEEEEAGAAAGGDCVPGSAADAADASSPRDSPEGGGKGKDHGNDDKEEDEEGEAFPSPSPVVPRWHWSPENVRLAREWAARATLLRWRHYEAAVYYSRLDRWLGIPIFFLTNAMGTALVAAALETAGGSCSSSDLASAGGAGGGASSCAAVVAVNWICAAASFLTAGLTGVLYYVDPSTVAQKHLEKAAAYDDIYRELELELSMAGPARQDPAHVLRHASARWSAVELRTPPLPARFRDKVPPTPSPPPFLPRQKENDDDVVVVCTPSSSSSSSDEEDDGDKQEKKQRRGGGKRTAAAAAAAYPMLPGDDHVSPVELSAAFQAHVDSFRTTARTDRIRYQLSRFESVHGSGSGSGSRAPPRPII